MKPITATVLTINGGSSGIKFALYDISDSLKFLFSGELAFRDNHATLNFRDEMMVQKMMTDFDDVDPHNAADFLIDQLEKQDHFNTINVIGHRIVHGMKHTSPKVLTPELLNDLKSITAYDPEHLPREIKLIEAFKKRLPTTPQVACFDTAFHSDMPDVAKLLSIPRRFQKDGIHRYGFHGLSYAYLLEELEKIAGKEIAHGKIIIAHLGNGASLAAIKNGKSIDTSMGFTPSSGIPMGTRTGDLDPGIAWYMMQFEKLTPKEFNHIVNHESGLLGISETSSDMRELLKIQTTDSRASEAIELFCYETKKNVGSFSAVLGGLETIIFSGGIGEHSPEVRSMICDGLQFLGIELDEIKNMNNQGIISSDESKVCVRVIKTNEELMIARTTCFVLNNQLP